MPNDLVCSLLPEEQELSNKMAELEEVKNILAQKELELTSTQIEVKTFENNYIKNVGVWIMELDCIRVEMAEMLLQKSNVSDEEKSNASSAKKRASDSAKVVENADSMEEPIIASDTLKALYRELVKKAHPDLGLNEEERARRNRFMVEVNHAYKKGNEKRLKDLLEEWQTSPESVIGEDIGKQLVRIIREIAQVKKRILEIEDEIGAIVASSLYTLKIRVETEQNNGRDVLSEMAEKIKEEIAIEKRNLEKFHNKIEAEREEC
jgi:hypothetical protein